MSARKRSPRGRVAGEDGWDVLGAFCAERVKPAEGMLVDLVVEEQECGHRLVLSAFGDLAVDSEMGQEPFDFSDSHAGWMNLVPGSLMLKAEKLFGLAEISLGSPASEMLLETGLSVLFQAFYEKNLGAREFDCQSSVASNGVTASVLIV